jgi:Na+-transporting NADH:ubiquinone oxidoreductase subunit C
VDKESNGYTLGYATIVTVIVAVVLALLFTSLKDLHDANEKLAKRKDILKAVGLVGLDNPDSTYNADIEGIIYDYKANIVLDTTLSAETIDVAKEAKLKAEKRKYPLFIYTNQEGSKKYIVPVYGSGLWDKIWGYIALEEDCKTIAGVSFDHKAETPGLGAEIKDNPSSYNDPFVGTKLFNAKGEYVSVKMVKGKIKNSDHEVNAVSGATVTSNGVTDMLFEDLQSYFPYLEKASGKQIN